MFFCNLVFMYKAIIFDLGKVIFDVSFDRTYQYWATASGSKFEDIKHRFKFDEVYDKFETAELTAPEFRTKMSEKLNINLSDAEFDVGWCNLYLRKYDGIDNLLNELKKNYKIIALSNTNEIHARVWKVKYKETLALFDKVFSSYEMKARKPSKESYQMVLDHLQLKPEETVFLDDNILNCEGAKMLGMTTILVTSQEQMKAELKNLGLL